jgi:hypothetical protein
MQYSRAPVRLGLEPSAQFFFFPSFIKLPPAKFFPQSLAIPHPQTQNIDLQPMGAGKSTKVNRKNKSGERTYQNSTPIQVRK